MAGETDVRIHTSNINQLWADLLVDELVRCGVRMFCLSPGSRSTPLTMAVAAHPDAPHVMHFDERGSAFFALGFARATGRPAAWITTSGTAVANGLPAVVEASVSGVPLILLTADRPPELRDTGANQTIDQVKIFGNYASWQFDLPAPDVTLAPETVLTTVDQAVYRSRKMPCGPVHLNCMFREPLAPDDDGRDYSDRIASLASWIGGSLPYTDYTPAEVVPSQGEIDRLAASLQGIDRGLIVAGRLVTKAQGDAVRLLAECLGWPVLPDVASQLRLGQQVPYETSIPYFDLVLASEPFRSTHAPVAVLHFGDRSTSKRLAAFLSEIRPAKYIVIQEAPNRFDPHHHVTAHVEADIVSFSHRLADRILHRAGAREYDDHPPRSDWLDSWQSASEGARQGIEEFIAESDALSEPAVARLVSESTKDHMGLFLASSMPVRDVDTYGSPDGPAPFVASNRGASGIDGTLASAAGFARGLNAPVTLLLGDLALLHDLNSLALAARSDQPITIVVVNNHGGGIFSFLPIARHTDVFETYFGTPHPYAFEHAAAMFDIPYEAPTTIPELRDALTTHAGATVLIEVITDRDENVRLHRELEHAVAARQPSIIAGGAKA